MKKVLLFFIFLSLTLSSCKTYYVKSKTKTQYHKVNKKLDDTSSKEIEEIIAPYKKKLDAKMNEVIGYCDGLTKTRLESTMGNWVSDAIYKKASLLSESKIDFAIQNYGGLRIGEISKGEVSIGKMFELMPFENYLVVLKASGKVTKIFLDRMANYGGWPISHSLKYTIENDKATDIYIHGKPFDINKSYNIALPDYIANGGDKSYFFKDQPRETFGVLIRDILIEETKESYNNGKHIFAKIEGRVTKK